MQPQKFNVNTSHELQTDPRLYPVPNRNTASDQPNSQSPPIYMQRPLATATFGPHTSNPVAPPHAAVAGPSAAAAKPHYTCSVCDQSNIVRSQGGVSTSVNVLARLNMTFQGAGA